MEQNKMPRGALPTLRNELAAAEPYRPDPAGEVAVPSGPFPTPNFELAAARPYRTEQVPPPSFLVWPLDLPSLAPDRSVPSSWAEEAFAKACASPKVLIPAEVVRSTARKCGTRNFAEFTRTHGFQLDKKTYLNGPFRSVDWTDEAALHSAIASVGPVKIGVASASLMAGPHGRITPGRSGWAVYGCPGGQPENHCASLCGYGTLQVLAAQFREHDVSVDLLPDMPVGMSYALFTWGSIGIIDRQSLLNITGEAWVRAPTTIVRSLCEPQ